MKRVYKRLIFSTLAFSFLGISACTDLDETPYSSINAAIFYNNKEEVISAVLRPYTHANAWAAPTSQRSYYRLNELSADQLAWPVKGQHGYDGGDWIRLHYHTWTPTEDNIWNPWRLMYWGLGFCNNTLADFERLDFSKIGITEEEKNAFIAETKVIRAWHYMKLMDLYGNIPIVTTVGEPLSPPTQPRAEVFKFIEKELKENVDLLPVLSPSMAGRVNRAAGYAMLAELYLNAEVWSGTERMSGTPRWDDCIAACDKILSGQTGGLNGVAALDATITDPFNNINENSKENLFQLAYDYQLTPTRCGWNGDFYHFNHRFIYGGDANGNCGVVVIPSAFDQFKDNDLRKSTWLLIGPQYKYGTNEPVTGGYEYRDKPLVFVKEIMRMSEGKTESNMTTGEENSGARFNKYVPGQQTDPNYWSNDWVLYRLTDIYFAKAEALMRKNGGVATPEAVELINACRKRSFRTEDWATEAYTTGTLTMDELLAERGREFIFEGKRRTDLIRFGKFSTQNWWDHTPSDPNKELFPIPQRQLAANPNLKQNPGY